MRIIQSFDNTGRGPVQILEVGAVEDFAFDITARVGSARILSVQFTLRLTAFSAGADMNPNSRLNDPRCSNTGVNYRTQDDVLMQAAGFFAIVRVGALPASAADGTYLLAFQAFLDDGQIIQGSSTVQCVLPGGQ